MMKLKKLDITTIIDLRAETKHDENFLQLFENADIAYLQIPFCGDTPPKKNVYTKLKLSVQVI